MREGIYLKPKPGPYVRRSALRVIEDPRVEKKLRDLARRSGESLLAALEQAVDASLESASRGVARSRRKTGLGA
jgi:hypothetical protein